MKYWIIAIVTAMYVFGTIMSIFGFVVCLLIFKEDKLDDDDIIRRPGRIIYIETKNSQSLSKNESDFLLLFLVCLGSLALILTGRIILAFYGIKAHRIALYQFYLIKFILFRLSISDHLTFSVPEFISADLYSPFRVY